jgi:polyketide synthase 12
MSMDTPAPITEHLSELQRAGLAIKALRSKLSALESARHEPIAIVGMSCRFPGAEDARAFWQLLSEGRDAVGDVPEGRWDSAAHYDPEPGKPGKMYTKAGGYLRDLELFDAAFFGLVPREAQAMEPQQRLLLETSWEALEDAGEHYERAAGAPVGVFVGITSGDYGMRVRDEADLEYLDGHYLAGNPLSFAAGRLAYTYGFTGPCLAVDTACSSSLTALHLAVRSLRSRECKAALAAGVNVVLCPKSTAMLCQANLISPTGRCRTFDASADGIVRGDGVGVLVLKRLSDALADGNQIHALIRGTALSQDGPSSTLTAPNGRAQEEVIRAALADAQLEPGEISYLEAHGTGTHLGDPIEVTAAASVYGRGRAPSDPLWIGSVKTNVGHLESAAGMAGLMKLILGLKNERMARQLHFSTPNPEIDWERSGLRVCAEDRPWPRSDRPRRAALSGFGASGTNAHVIVEEAPALNPESVRSADERVHSLILSAPSASALELMTRRLAAHLRAHPEQRFEDVVYTLQTGRHEFEFRRSVVCSTREQACRLLEQLDSDSVSTNRVPQSQRAALAWSFPALADLPLPDSRGLREREPVYRDHWDRCVSLLCAQLGTTPVALMDAGGTASPESELGSARAFAAEYALGSLLLGYGVKPQLLAGRGGGELVAACLAGVMTLEDAVHLLLERLRPGSHGGARPARALTLKAPAIPLLSNLSGQRVTSEDARDPEYWRRLGRAALTASTDAAGDGIDRIWRAIEPSKIAGPRQLQQFLSELWLNGVAIDWHAAVREPKPRKTSLPSYPFERKRYWIELATDNADRARARRNAKLPVSEWFQLPTWKVRNLPRAQASTEPLKRKHWLVFSTAAAERLGTLARLRAHGASVTRVQPGDAFAEVAPGDYTVRPDCPEDYAALLETVARSSGLPDIAIHEWNVSAPEPEPLAVAALEAALQSGFLSAVYLARALRGTGSTQPVRVCLVSNNAQSVTGADLACPARALGLGPALVMHQEQPSLSCIAVDVDLRGDPAGQAELLLADALSAGDDTLVAYRERSRFVRTFDALSCAPPSRPALRERGVYLITGGLGGVGLALATELAKRCRARLALLGRRELGAPESEAVRRLERAGAEVLVVRADVSDRAGLDEALRATHERFGAIHGVIHAAGLPGAGLMATKSRAEAERVLAPKVGGSLALCDALREEGLDFLLLCSSSIGVLGGIGQSDYAAANAFMDALAQYESARGMPVVSVAWDLWQTDSWQAELLSGAPSLLSHFKALRERFGIRPEEGAQVLEHLALAGHPHVVVATRSFEREQADSREATIDKLLSTPAEPRTVRLRPELRVPYVAPASDMEKTITALWTRIFELDRVGVNDDYFELGGDSLNGLQVVTHVRQAFGVELSLHDLFAQPTPAGLALLIEERIVQSLEVA